MNPDIKVIGTRFFITRDLVIGLERNNIVDLALHHGYEH